MNQFLMKVLGVAALVLAFAAGANAQSPRTWVSANGDDVNPCDRTSPCKTFAGAISKTLAGGEITVLDSGAFGSVTITKAITINGDGALAGILSAGTNAVNVNAGAADVVILRGLSINGAGSGTNGIRFLNGGHLVVENTTIQGFTQRGIDVSLTASRRLTVRDTTIIGGNTSLYVTSTVGTPFVAVSNVALRGASYGINALAGNVDVRESVISQHSVFGVYADGISSISLENTAVIGNEVAVQSQAGAAVYLSDTDVFNNRNGFGCGGGFLASANNNRKANNLGGLAPRCAPNATILVQ
jgi:hypothetical protein